MFWEVVAIKICPPFLLICALLRCYILVFRVKLTFYKNRYNILAILDIDGFQAFMNRVQRSDGSIYGNYVFFFKLYSSPYAVVSSANAEDTVGR